MARILFSEHTNITWTKETIFDCHAESFISALKEMGHTVLCVATNHLCESIFDNSYRYPLVKQRVKKIIQEFKPELIITYNNSLPKGVHEITDCPIVVYPADIITSWTAMDTIQKYLDRYYFLDATKAITQSIRETFEGICERQIIPFGHITGVHNTFQEKIVPISFVGSLMDYAYLLQNYFNRLPGSAEEKNQIKDAFFLEYDRWNRENDSFNFSGFVGTALEQRQNYQAVCIKACASRMKYLDALTDLGLKIYGYHVSWERCCLFNPELFRCYDYKQIATLEESTALYNSCKISFNPPQGSATDGFSWRVPDILASGSVLLSNPKKDLVDLMRPYYPDMPYYTSPVEAREIAKKLLVEESWRNEIVAASNAMIEDHCRLAPKIRDIFGATGVGRADCDSRGEISIMDIDEICYPFVQLERRTNPRVRKLLIKLHNFVGNNYKAKK